MKREISKGYINDGLTATRKLINGDTGELYNLYNLTLTT